MARLSPAAELPTIWTTPDDLWQEFILPILRQHDPEPRTGRPRTDPRKALEGYESNSPKLFSQFKVGSPFGHGITYEPRLLGYLAYDPAKRLFTRFDLVALGDLHGRPCGENVVGERLGQTNLLGIAFTLVTDPKPADLLCPKGLGSGEWYDLPRYLGQK